MFFVPKKPVQFQDSVTVHWLVIQAKGPSSTEAHATPSNQDDPQTISSASSDSAQLSNTGHISAGIDMDKVKDMLGQLQIGKLPQGAQDLMKAVEAQSVRSPSSTLSSSSFNPLSMAMMSMALAPGPQRMSTSVTSVTSVTPSTAPTDDSIYVTKAELAQLEDRITVMIDQKFLQLEERIMARLNNSS
ncbi:hypothetical protein BG006_004847 [Podila minutissima]|uniref:Uncharacterized protein n=1 Tax=Podila minutissima TaxID=64525 RepID=A0A9P5SV34_9FUNG|nr:hypothetical protein BG006_004847 [Podila minutissima]